MSKMKVNAEDFNPQRVSALKRWLEDRDFNVKASFADKDNDGKLTFIVNREDPNHLTSFERKYAADNNFGMQFTEVAMER